MNGRFARTLGTPWTYVMTERGGMLRTNRIRRSSHHVMFRFLAAVVAASAVALCPSPARASALEYVVVEAEDPAGAVVFLHGWSQGLTADVILPSVEDAAVIGQIVDAGWTVYVPFLDSDWGMAWASVDEMVVVAERDGFDMGRVRLVGMSAGAVTALNWAWRNPDAVESVHLITPVFDLGALYVSDTPEGWAAPSITESLERRFGPDFVSGSAAFDPARHVDELVGLGFRIGVFAARDDEIIDWDALSAWSDLVGASMAASAEPGADGGGHGYATSTPAWALTAALWFAAPTPPDSVYPSEDDLRVIVEEWREDNRPDLEFEPMLEVAVTYCTDATDPMILAMLIDNGDIAGNLLDFLMDVCPQVIAAADAVL